MPLQNSPIPGVSQSPFAQIGSISHSQVQVSDNFWRPRQEVARTVSLPSQQGEIERTGRFDNFRRAIGEIDGEYKHLAADSDVFKWMEGLAYSLATHPDPKIEAMLDEAIDLVTRSQDNDGYLNSAFARDKKAERWTNLHRSHELYNGGHLIQAAVAHYRATRKTNFLAVALRWADLVCSLFGPHNPATDGHPEIEMALVELYRVTGYRPYLEQALFFTEMRGQKPSPLRGEDYQQDHAPIRQQNTAKGHAVRQFYLSSGVADLYAELGDETLWQALEAQWNDFTQKKMHVTGGAGVMRKGEGLGEAYELPNKTAYNETCAAIAAAMWHFRMLQITGEVRYADHMENALYNGVLSGISQKGDAYFYTNPLEHDGGHNILGEGRGSCERTRVHWDHVACCPPNLARLIPSIGGYAYGQSENALWVHLFIAGSLKTRLGGAQVTIRQQHDYPWEGRLNFEIEVAEGPASFELKVRVPAWAMGAVLQVNDEATQSVEAGQYATISRQWSSGDRVTLDLPFEVQRVRSHPRATDNAGCVALRRGPLVFCLEQVDHPGEDLFGFALPRHAPIEAKFQPDLLGGTVSLHARGKKAGDDEALYGTAGPRFESEASLTFIPYALWTNREPGAMRVWIPEV